MAVPLQIRRAPLSSLDGVRSRRVARTGLCGAIGLALSLSHARIASRRRPRRVPRALARYPPSAHADIARLTISRLQDKNLRMIVGFRTGSAGAERQGATHVPRCRSREAGLTFRAAPPGKEHKRPRHGRYTGISPARSGKRGSMARGKRSSSRDLLRPTSRENTTSFAAPWAAGKRTLRRGVAPNG